jgi:hypothetical protein
MVGSSPGYFALGPRVRLTFEWIPAASRSLIIARDVPISPISTGNSP